MRSELLLCFASIILTDNKKPKKEKGMPVGLIAGLSVVCIGGLAVYCWWRNHRREKREKYLERFQQLEKGYILQATYRNNIYALTKEGEKVDNKQILSGNYKIKDLKNLIDCNVLQNPKNNQFEALVDKTNKAQESHNVKDLFSLYEAQQANFDLRVDSAANEFSEKVNAIIKLLQSDTTYAQGVSQALELFPCFRNPDSEGIRKFIQFACAERKHILLAQQQRHKMLESSNQVDERTARDLAQLQPAEEFLNDFVQRLNQCDNPEKIHELSELMTKYNGGLAFNVAKLVIKWHSAQ